MKSNNNNNKAGLSDAEAAIDWEMRPGGMLVQKRDDAPGPSGPMIKIKVSHGTAHHDLSVPAQSTFGKIF